MEEEEWNEEVDYSQSKGSSRSRRHFATFAVALSHWPRSAGAAKALAARHPCECRRQQQPCSFLARPKRVTDPAWHRRARLKRQQAPRVIKASLLHFEGRHSATHERQPRVNMINSMLGQPGIVDTPEPPPPPTCRATWFGRGGVHWWALGSRATCRFRRRLSGRVTARTEQEVQP